MPKAPELGVENMSLSREPITVAGLSVSESGHATSPSICFLHGGGVSGWMWRPQVEALKDSYHCLVPDLPEHGRSAGVRPFTIADTALRIARIIRERGHGGRAHVIGLSEGAQVTVQLLSIAPEVVDHAIVSSASLHPLRTFGLMSPMALGLTYWLFVAPFKHSERYVRWNMRGTGTVPDHYFSDVRTDIGEMTAGAFIHMTRQNQDFRLPSGLERVQSPTLVIAGRHEYDVMRRSAKELAAVLPHAQGYFVSVDQRLAHEHSWNLWAPDLFTAATYAWIEDRPLPPGLQAMK
jgi:pimeloyl-ACP methyl ester carboxylesterase